MPGKGTVTEPGARPSQPVDVTTPARKPSTIRLDQDPNTGDVTVIPMKPGGGTYPSGTKVEIPGKNGNPIVVTIGEDGKGTVPNTTYQMEMYLEQVRLQNQENQLRKLRY